MADTQDTHPEYEINERDLDFMFNVNLKGPIWFSQAVAKYFIKQRKGKIINISSEAGQEGSALVAEYKLWPSDPSCPASLEILIILPFRCLMKYFATA